MEKEIFDKLPEVAKISREIDLKTIEVKEKEQELSELKIKLLKAQFEQNESVIADIINKKGKPKIVGLPGTGRPGIGSLN